MPPRDRPPGQPAPLTRAWVVGRGAAAARRCSHAGVPLPAGRGSDRLRAVGEPLAYFLTWRTFGTWLHGDDRGSVDRRHNSLGAPLLPPEPAFVQRNRSRMAGPAVVLGQRQRHIVDAAIRERCRHAGWVLLALNVRTNHVHAVVAASEPAEQVMASLKAWATRTLREEGAAAGKTWARDGSTRYLWDEAGLENACAYVNDLQDSPHS